MLILRSSKLFVFLVSLAFWLLITTGAVAAAPVPALRGLRGLAERGLGVAAMHGAATREIAVAETLHRLAPIRVLVLCRSRHQRHLVLVVWVCVVILRLIIIDRVIIIGAD